MSDESLEIIAALETARDAYDDARGHWLCALAAAAAVLPMNDLTDLTGMTDGHIRAELAERDRLLALVAQIGG